MGEPDPTMALAMVAMALAMPQPMAQPMAPMVDTVLLLPMVARTVLAMAMVTHMLSLPPVALPIAPTATATHMVLVPLLMAGTTKCCADMSQQTQLSSFSISSATAKCKQ